MIFLLLRMVLERERGYKYFFGSVTVLILLLMLLINIGFISASVQDDFLVLINQERAKLGVSALSIDNRLTQAGYLHSKDMVENHYFTHDSKDGRKFSDRIKAQGYTYYSAGENIAYHYGKADSRLVFEMWKASNGHYANMISSKFVHMGLGIYSGNGYTYYTLDLGKPRTSSGSGGGGVIIGSGGDGRGNVVVQSGNKIVAKSRDVNQSCNSNSNTRSGNVNYVLSRSRILRNSIDRIRPSIKKIFPKRFTNGNFNVIFYEKNSYEVILTIDYGDKIVNYSVDDCTPDSRRLGQYNCSKFVDLSTYNGKLIKYSFMVIDNSSNYRKYRDVRVMVDTKKPEVNSFNYNFDRRRIEMIFNISEENLLGIYYKDIINGDESRLRYRRLCSRLRDGVCKIRRSFRTGDHVVEIKIIDKAGNSAENINLEFSCDNNRCLEN